MTEREQIIMCALRYSLYRRSYIPSVCRGEIRREVEEENLSQRAIAQAIHEINEVELHFNRWKKVKQDWYQRDEWIKLRDWLREKLMDEKEIQWLKQVGDEL